MSDVSDAIKRSKERANAQAEMLLLHYDTETLSGLENALKDLFLEMANPDAHEEVIELAFTKLLNGFVQEANAAMKNYNILYGILKGCNAEELMKEAGDVEGVAEKYERCADADETCRELYLDTPEGICRP